GPDLRGGRALPGGPQRTFRTGRHQVAAHAADRAAHQLAVAGGRLPEDRGLGHGDDAVREVSAVLAIASRDITKLLRDRARLGFSLIFPIIFIGLMGGTLQSNLGRAAGFNFIGFIFSGVLGMTLFQSSAQGLLSLIEDRENDFSQEMFVSPISRYSIIFGKILGETGVSLVQAVPMVLLALVFRVPLTPLQVLLLVPAAIIACLLGGAFGVAVMSLLSSQRAA